MVDQTESILSLLRRANRKCHKSTYPQADLWLGVWWIFRLTLSNPYCLDLAKSRKLMSTGRQSGLDVGNRDPTFDWAIDQRSLPFRQPLEGDLQIKERDLCHKWKCKPQKRKRKCVKNKGNNYHTKFKDVSNKSSFSFFIFVRNNIFSTYRPLITLGIWNRELKNWGFCFFLMVSSYT